MHQLSEVAKVESRQTSSQSNFQGTRNLCNDGHFFYELILAITILLIRWLHRQVQICLQNRPLQEATSKS